jgi:hypothetical protein
MPRVAPVYPIREQSRDSAASEEEVHRWLRRQVAEGCQAIVLRQTTDHSEQQIRGWELNESTDLGGLAERIYAYAVEDGRHFAPGTAMYGLLSYRANESAIVERMFIRLPGSAAALATRVERTESPELAGVVAQLMRHNEIATKVAIGQTADIIQQYQRMLEARDRRIEELEARHNEVLELHEKLLSMQHQRELDRLRAQRDERRQEFFREKLDMLAPVLVSKFMGGGAQGGPAKNAVLGEEMIRQFLKSLRPDQFDRLMGGLDPEQAALIGQIYVAYGERETANEAAKAAHAAQTEE